MNEITNDKFMTTKELAETLGVSVDSIQNAVKKLTENNRRLFNNVHRNNQGGYLFSEAQATLIKQEIQKHHNLASRQIDSISTELTPKETFMTIKEVSSILNVTPEAIKKHIRVLYPNLLKNGIETKLTEAQVTEVKSKMLPTTSVVGSVTSIDIERMTLQVIEYHRNKVLELQQQNAEMRPKAEAYDSFIERGEFSNFRESAQLLGLKQNEFMRLLKSKYIYKNNAGQYRAYAEYADLFTLRPFNKPNGKTEQQLMMNIKGLQFFQNKLYQKYIAPPPVKKLD